MSLHLHPLRHRYIRRSLSMLALGVALSSTASASPKSVPVTGTFNMQVVGGEGCTSPVGVCAAGTASGDLAGDVFVTITSSAVGVDASGAYVSNYTADIDIHTAKGEINGTIVGSVQLATGDLRSTVTIDGGSRRYNHTTGTLNVTGHINLATGVEVDSYNGTIDKH